MAVSREILDALYDPTSSDGQELERRTIAYGTDRLRNEIKYTFSVLKQIIEACSNEANYLRSTVRPGGKGQNPIKAPLYAIFMAFFDLIVKEQKTPADNARIMTALRGLAGRLQTLRHYETTKNRSANINVTKGLVQQFFVTQVPPVFGHGPSLILDFENAVRRSKIESSRYEFKQGILRLDARRQPDTDLLPHLVQTACGVANLGPDADGNIFIGVADKTSCEPTAHRFVFSDSASLRFCRLGPTAHRFDWWQRQLLFATLGHSFAPVPPLPASVPVTTRETSQIGGRTRHCAARPPASGATRPRRSRPAMQAGTATSRRRRCRLRPTFKGVMRCRMESPSDEAMRCRFATSDAERIATLDGVSPQQIAEYHVVGVDREARLLT